MPDPRVYKGPPPAQQAAYAELAGEVRAAVLRDDPVPCMRDPDPGLWTSDEPADQDAAAARCLAGAGCPALEACAIYGLLWPREWGTYGGLTEYDRSIKRRGLRRRDARAAAATRTTKQALTTNRKDAS